MLCFLGGSPGFFNVGDLLLEGGNICFPCWLMYLRGVSYEQVEWCFLCCCRGPRVLGILSKWKPCMPIVLLIATEDAQILFKGLVGALTCSIGLRVICCADVLLDIEKMAEF